MCLARGDLTVDNFLNSTAMPSLCSGAARRQLSRVPFGFIEVLRDRSEWLLANGPIINPLLLGY